MKNFREFCNNYKRCSDCRLSIITDIECESLYKMAIENDGKIIIDISKEMKDSEE